MTHALPLTPDYDVWPIEANLKKVFFKPRLLTVCWSDGRESRFHSIWLRENAADKTTVNPATRERILDLSTLPSWPEIADAKIDEAGALCVDFAPEGQRLRFHPGWLRAHDYDNTGDPEVPLVPVTTWKRDSGEGPDNVDAMGLLDTKAGGEAEEKILTPALTSILGKGLVRLRNLPTKPDSLEAIAQRIGPVRPTNFGMLFDVKAKPNPDSNAYTSIALPPHVDLPTREYQPGMQMLHCLENSVEGGEAVMLDGFAVAEALREHHPDAFTTLTRVRWCFANTAKTTDYVWYSPIIRLDEHGEPFEVRIADFLRGPLQTNFEDVEPAYEALIVLQKMLHDPAFAIRFTYKPGDLVIFDNRRLLHARDAFEGTSGHRWLQGCYMERDEICSRYRMVKRARHQREVAAEASLA
ncbi:TauD/TfdA family dioxygenase [Vreelandella rituensis]|uniref:Taurine catabolism dioxygenase TauD n=1 Tax=Vreelandella rituensis TaxID=2282306 RepID=A0A368U838_9GAMM|nr:TauD/TfdA family dioxygenase [Halomonas rituensis]RCV93135.1 taurine catabolism dioxygenase TauD [Halomonas rituensis]